MPKLSSTKTVLKGEFYNVVVPNETFRGMTYSDLMQDYYNWIYSSNPDVRQDMDIFFLRGNAFGDPYVVPKENTSRFSTYEILTDPRYVYDRTGLRAITISTNTVLFINVFDSIFFVGDTFEDNELKTPYECRLAARKEFKLTSAIWARIEGLGKFKGPIVEDLRLFYVESSPITVSVSDKNKLTREPDYKLTGGTYTGVAAGVFLLIGGKGLSSETTPKTRGKVDIQNASDRKLGLPVGKYRVDFGGTQSVDYFTRAVYDINVNDIDAWEVPDKSKELEKFPYP